MLVPTSPGASNDSRMTWPSHTASTTFVPAPPSQRACQRPSQKSNCLRGSSMPVGRTNAGRGLPIPQFRDNAAVRVINLPRLRPITFRVREPDGGVSMIEGTWSEARRIESWPPPSLARAVQNGGGGEPAPSFAVRRPIYDRGLDVHAYALLFRAGDTGQATAETVVTTFADIGLDGFVVRGDSMPLLEVADYVKLDARVFSRDELAEQVAELEPYDVELIAAGIEDHATFELCKEVGFDYFQGDFL